MGPLDVIIPNPLDEPTGETRSDGGTATAWTRTNADPAGNPTDRCTWSADPGSEWCRAVGQSFTTAPAVHTTTGYDARNPICQAEVRHG